MIKNLAFVPAMVLAGLASQLAACQPSAQPPPTEYAVYAEYSDANKPMAPDWNTRIFDRREAQQGSSIQLEDKTGVVTLEPGLYHITATSMVTYFDPKNPSVTPVNATPPGGYARLRYLSDVSSATSGNDKAIAISTVGNADTIPSLVDTFLKVEKEAKIVLEHQVGADVKNIYLHVNGNGSVWHVFARISIQRLPS